MAIDLYLTPGSLPCRTVLLVAAALDLKLNHHIMDLRAGDQFKPDFLKLNPQHTVPTIVDEGFALWESRAISRYLVNKYGVDTDLYPIDPVKRAIVDQRLDFDLGTLYPRFEQYFFPPLFSGEKPDPALLKKVEEALVFFDTFLSGQKYAAGDVLTIADLSLVATISTYDIVDIDLKPYSNVSRWYELVKSTAPAYDKANDEGLKQFKQFINQARGKTEL